MTGTKHPPLLPLGSFKLRVLRTFTIERRNKTGIFSEFEVAEFEVLRSTSKELNYGDVAAWVHRPGSPVTETTWDFLCNHEGDVVYCHTIEKQSKFRPKDGGAVFKICVFSDKPQNRCPHCGEPGLTFHQVRTLQQQDKPKPGPCTCEGIHQNAIGTAALKLALLGRDLNDEALVSDMTSMLTGYYLSQLRSEFADEDVEADKVKEWVRTFFKNLKTERKAWEAVH